MAKPVRFRDRWRIRWTDADGARQSAVFDTERDARLVLQRKQVEAEEIRRGLAARPVQAHSFADLVAYWKDHRLPKKRSQKDDLSILRRHLEPAFGTLRLVDVTVSRVDAFIKTTSCSEKTLHNVLTLLISLLNCSVELGWLQACPRIKKPKVAVLSHDFCYLRTDQEITRFLRAALAEGEGVHALYATAVYTGMRAGELAGLRWSDVDLDRRLITVQRSYEGPTKAGRIRHAPILDALLPTLRAWRLLCPGNIVFPNEAGEMQHPSARVFQEVFQRVMRAAKFDDVDRRGKKRPPLTFHGLRHTFASHWMMRGGDIFKLQRICGWQSFSMVQRYAHLSPEAYAQDYARLGAAPAVQRNAPVVPIKSRAPVAPSSPDEAEGPESNRG